MTMDDYLPRIDEVCNHSIDLYLKGDKEARKSAIQDIEIISKLRLEAKKDQLDRDEAKAKQDLAEEKEKLDRLEAKKQSIETKKQEKRKFWTDLGLETFKIGALTSLGLYSIKKEMDGYSVTSSVGKTIHQFCCKLPFNNLFRR